MSLSVVFDHEQRRLATDRTWVTANGQELAGELDGGVFSGTFLDLDGQFRETIYGFEGLTNTLFLRPYCLEAAWWTSNAGNYAKLGSGDVTYGTSGNWEVTQDMLGAGPFHKIKDTLVSDTLITNTTWGVNRGMYVALFSYTGGEVFLSHKMGWNTTATDAGGVALHVYTDGNVEIYKGGVAVGYGKVGGFGQAMFQQLILLPGRQRELIIISVNNGEVTGGFSHTFADIDYDDTTPEITPATKFWVQVIKGGCMVQLAPLKFPTSGYASSVTLSFPEAPATGASLESYDQPTWNGGGTATYAIWGHPSYGVGTQGASAALYETDSTTAFVADSSLKDCRLRVTLTTSDSGYTPFVSAAEMAYAASFDVTDDSESHDATSSVLSATLSVPEDAGGVVMDLHLKDPQGLSADVLGLDEQSNRPVSALIGANIILDGFASIPDETVGISDEVGRATLEVYDYWRTLEDYRFKDRIALDRSSLTGIIEFLAKLTGIQNTDISTDAFEINPDPSPDSNDWSSLITVRDTAASVLQRLHQDYWATAWYGIRPSAAGAEFFWLDPADLTATADVTLYSTVAEAMSVGGYSTAEEAQNYVYRSFGEERLPPEATRVYITGYDPRSRRPIQAFKIAATLEDPTTLPSLRPDGWVGGQLPYAKGLSELATQDDCNRTCDYLFDRLSVRRRLCTWRSELLVYGSGDDSGYPLWRGRLVRLYGRGLWRINSFGCKFVLEGASDGLRFRDATYTAEYVGPEPEE